MLTNGLNNPNPLTLFLVFGAGLLTSLGPCSISLMPITVAYLAGFKEKEGPMHRSFIFCSGIVLSLVILGFLSGFIGKIYGQIPNYFSTLISLVVILMGLNLMGIIKIPLPTSPDPEKWRERVPKSLGTISAGLAFGLASSPCTTPVIAVLLAWIAQKGDPLLGILLLVSFGIGQVTPLFIAGSFAASIPKFLELKPISRWIPSLSGLIFLVSGSLSLISRWI